MASFDLEQERLRIRKEAAKHFLAAQSNPNNFQEEKVVNPVNEDVLEEEPVPANLAADIGRAATDSERIVVQGPRPKRKRPEKITPVEDEEMVAPTTWKGIAEIAEGDEDAVDAEEVEEEDIVDQEAEEEEEEEDVADAEEEDAEEEIAEVEEEEEIAEEEDLEELGEEDLDDTEDVDEHGGSDDIDDDDYSGEGGDDDDYGERPTKRRRVAKAKPKPKKEKVSRKPTVVLTPESVMARKDGTGQHGFTPYEKRIRRIPAANFSILDGAYLSDYGLTATLRKATKKGCSTVVHHAQVLAQVAQEHKINIRGFTSENKKKGVYEKLPCGNTRESEGGTARVVFIGKFKKTLKDVVGSVFCLLPEDVVA